MAIYPISDNTILQNAIQELKQQKDVVLLAHYYQVPEIQDVADHVGDSLGLARKAAETDAGMIAFAGVHFMAETAKVLNPNKKVVLPDREAGCSLAESCPPDEFHRFVKAHPDHTVVSYINCSAAIKALSDWVCTSTNAKDVLAAIPEEEPVIFAPDKNLGRYLQKETGRSMLLWEGSCTVHEAFSIEKLLDLHRKHPQARIIAHPESESHILRAAAFIGSTGRMLEHVKASSADEFIVATEAGIIHQMRKEVPDKKLIPAPVHADNTCGCSECAFMKLNTLEKLYRCLRNEEPAIEVEESIRKKALRPIQRMLELGNRKKQQEPEKS